MSLNQRLQILQQKSSSIKKTFRQNQLQKKMKYFRKNLIKAWIEQQIQPRRQKQTYLISELISNLKQNHSDTIFKLWQHCLSFSHRYLTEQQIQLIVKKLKQIPKSNKKREEELTMGIWLISNWATTKNQLISDFQELIQFLGQILDQKLNVKLNQYILYSFINLCIDSKFAKKIIKGKIINKILNCPTLKEKQSDVALFLNNCLLSLQGDQIIQDTVFKQIIRFVKRTLKKSTSDYILRKDSFYIIKTLISKTYQQQIIRQLFSQLKILMMTIQSITQLKSCKEMFSMLTVIIEIDSQNLGFIDQNLVRTIWNCTKNLLCLQYTITEQVDEHDQLINQIWKFMPHFVKKVGQLMEQQILNWLFQQCILSQDFQSEDKALIFLAQNLKNENLIIQLCLEKLDQYKNMQLLTEVMLKALKRVLQNHERNMQMQHKKQLYQSLNKLIDHQNEAVSALAIEIEEKLSENKMQEQDQTKDNILKIN